MLNQQLPYSIEIEKYILGSLMSDKTDYVIKLSEADFYNQTNLLIYKAIKHLHSKKQPVDAVSVSDILTNRLDNALQVLLDIDGYVTTTANFEAHIKELKRYTTRREILKKTLEIEEMALAGEYDNSIDLKNDVLQKLSEVPVQDEVKNRFDMKSIMGSVVDEIEKKYNAEREDALFTGFYDFDKITAGFHPEELSIIAARPGVGKTALAIQLMINLASKGNHCLMVSREMSTLQIAKRILSNISGVDGHKLRLCKSLTGPDFTKIANNQSKIEELTIEINDKASTIQDIRAYSRELKNKGKLDILIVDYLQLVQTMKKCSNRNEEVADISRELKKLTMEFNIPVIALSQLNRDNARTGKEPELHDLRESGAIEQDADNVFFLHVPKDTDETADLFDIKVIIGKQRNGATGFIWLGYARKTFKLFSKSIRG
jgi:replicative DNA helicase